MNTFATPDGPPTGALASPDTSGVASFPWAESDLAKKMGLSRNTLRKIRDERVQGEDWELRGNAVFWSAEAVQQLQERLTHARAPMFISGPSNEAEKMNMPAPVTVETVTVTRWRIMNPHLIECVRADGSTIRVRVKSNVNFREKMHVKVHQDGDGWALNGRCPRFPGRM